MRTLFAFLPRFPIQALVAQQPWRQHQALAMVQDIRGQRRVAWASSAALKRGVVRGHSLTAAQSFVPDLAAVPFEEADTVNALLTLGEVLLAYGPAFQLAAPTGLWLDASAASLFGGELKWAGQVQQALKQLGFQSSVVVSNQLFTSQLLGRREMKLPLVVEPGQEYQLCKNLALSEIPNQPEALIERLNQVGLSTIERLSAVPAAAMAARFGADGVSLWKRIHLQTDLPFVAAALPETLCEQMEFGFPAESSEPVLFAMKSLTDKLCARLQGRNQAVMRLEVRLRLEPRLEERMTLSLARPSSVSRLLVDVFRVRLESLQLPNPVAAMSVTAVECCAAPERQLVLGDDVAQEASLELVLSRLSTALGESALSCLQVAKTFRPETASAALRFRPPTQNAPLELNHHSPTEEEPSGHGVERPIRFLHVPKSVEVLGNWTSVLVDNVSHEVSALHGPESVGGVWWGRAPTPNRDYFRVWLKGIGAAWIAQENDSGRFLLVGWFD